jgi:16S rRNA (cytidine1402-2'-O)-methyltransferase
MLYLVSTPIGNLADITFRAIETLKSCDYILCEDTRHSSALLKHYEISKPLVSYHKFSETAKADQIISDLKKGKHIALISDAGTPGISDPGALLVETAIAANIQVVSIPGACAAIAALTSSGLNTDLFQFVGFLPKKAQELNNILTAILTYRGTTICYESPQRLLSTLQALHQLAPDRPLVVARELTKKFEEIKRGLPADLIEYWENHPLKGEIVLLIAGQTQSKQEEWIHLSPEEHVQFLEHTYKLSRRDAIKMAAQQRGVPKRDIYNLFLRKT